MAIQSPEDFFSILEKSNLLDAEQILAARQSVEGLDDATVVARQLARDGVLTRWQAAQLLAGRSSFLLGKYKLIDLLGRGGMGRVFLGRHVTMQRPVALKIVAREVGSNPAALERFLAEARAIAALDHPAIVQAYSVDCEGDRYYIVMEYVDGRDLQRVVEEDGPLDCRTTVEYIRQAADGLAHAHERNLVHCDIKPSNLLVNSQGQVKILDMGMARLGGRDDEEDKPDDNHILGSVDYLAPEQALGSDSFDHRADIYSLGCTLYFLLTGHPPFPEGTLPERLLKHQTQQPRPIPTERPDVPPQLVQVCRRMIAKRPEDRFQSAEEIIAALAEVPAETGEAARAGAVGGTRPALGATRTDEPADERPDAAIVSDTGLVGLMKHGLATAVGRVVMGGFALLILLMVVGVSLAIVAATRSTPSRDGPGETAAALPPEPTISEDEEEGEEKDEEESQQEEFDLARAFFARVQAAKDASEAEQDAEEKAPIDNEKPGPPEPEQPATDPPDKEDPPAKDPPPTKPDDSEPEQPAEPPEPEPEKPATGEGEPTEPEKEPAKKPSPPRKEKPPTFRDFPKVAKLPSLAAGDGQASPPEPVTLGKLFAGERAPWIAVLRGGETVVPKAVLSLSRSAAEGGGQAYVFQLTPRGEEAADIARMWYEPKTNQLKFQWLEAATTTPGAELLRLCHVELTIDGESKPLAFSEPAPAPPLGFDLDNRTERVTIDCADLPDDSLLRLEITKIEGVDPKNYPFQTKPDGPVEAKRQLAVALQRMDRHRNPQMIARLQVHFLTTRKGLTVIRRIDHPQRFVLPKPAALLRQEGEKAFREKTAELKKAQSAGEKEQIQFVLNQIEHGLGQLDLIELINKQAIIHYRIFLQAGSHEVPLFDSQATSSTAGGTDAAQ